MPVGLGYTRSTPAQWNVVALWCRSFGRRVLSREITPMYFITLAPDRSAFSRPVTSDPFRNSIAARLDLMPYRYPPVQSVQRIESGLAPNQDGPRHAARRVWSVTTPCKAKIKSESVSSELNLSAVAIRADHSTPDR